MTTAICGVTHPLDRHGTELKQENLTVITIHIPGVPVPKARPRASSIGGKPTLYTPATTRAYEQAVKMAAWAAMAKAPPLEGAVSARVVVTLPVPESWSRAKRADALAGRVRPASRPDLDNYVKAVLDGCNGAVWRDDSQIVSLSAEKRYGSEPSAMVEVERSEVAR